MADQFAQGRAELPNPLLKLPTRTGRPVSQQPRSQTARHSEPGQGRAFLAARAQRIERRFDADQWRESAISVNGNPPRSPPWTAGVGEDQIPGAFEPPSDILG